MLVTKFTSEDVRVGPNLLVIQMKNGANGISTESPEQSSGHVLTKKYGIQTGKKLKNAKQLHSQIVVRTPFVTQINYLSQVLIQTCVHLPSKVLNLAIL